MKQEGLLHINVRKQLGQRLNHRFTVLLAVCHCHVTGVNINKKGDRGRRTNAVRCDITIVCNCLSFV